MLGNLLVFCLELGVCLNARKSFAVYVLVRPVTAGLRSSAVGGDTVTMLSTPRACGGVAVRCACCCLVAAPAPAEGVLGACAVVVVVVVIIGGGVVDGG